MTISPDTMIERPDGSSIAFGKLKPRDQLAHELIVELMPDVADLSSKLAAFKKRAIDEILAHREMMMTDHGVKVGGKGGNISIKSADGRLLVRYKVDHPIEFGPELEAAKALIDECLEDWGQSAGPELRAIITKVFKVNSKGRLDTSGILGLRSHAFEDERWGRAMDAIDEAIRRDRTASYISFFRVDPETGAETRIPLDIAKL